MPFDPLLTLIAAPMLAGALCLPCPDRFKAVPKLIAFVTTLAAFAMAVFVFLNKPSLSQYGESIVFLADNLSAFVAAAISLFALLITVYSLAFVGKSCGRYFGYCLMTLGAALGVVYANDLIVMLVFWGFVAALFYLLVTIDGSRRAAAAAQKALIIIGGTDAVMIFGIALVWALCGTFAMDKVRLGLSGVFSYAAFFSLAVASLAKAGAMPFHAWLPDVAEEAPAPVTAYLPASLDKLLGIYLLARISLDLFITNTVTNLVLVLVGAATIVLANLVTLVQKRMKRLLGYCAVSQVGFIVLGIGTGNPIGIAGGLFHMLNHAVYKSCLFLAAGAVEKQAGTQDLDRLGGLVKYMPLTFIAFLVAALSISGIPPFNGFVSKWMIYQGIIETAGSKGSLWVIWLTAAMFGSAVTIAAFMKLLHAVFLGRPSEGMKDVKEAGFLMLLPMSILAVLCLVFGVFAFTIPLPVFIMPATGLQPFYLGTWSPVLATALIAAGIILGFFIYMFLMPKKARVVDTFVGGEDPGSLPRVTGVDFYDTIRDLAGFRGLYKKEEQGLFDLYAVSRKPVYAMTRFMQFLHNGVLPTYMVWCLLGMIVMFAFLLFR